VSPAVRDKSAITTTSPEEQKRAQATWDFGGDLTSAGTANAHLITKFDLLTACLIQKGSAVNLTFNVACGLEPPLSYFHGGADYTVTARVEQRVGRTTVTNVPGASISGWCPDSRTTPFLVRITVYAPDAREAEVPTKARAGHGNTPSLRRVGGCSSFTSTKVVRLSKKDRWHEAPSKLLGASASCSCSVADHIVKRRYSSVALIVASVAWASARVATTALASGELASVRYGWGGWPANQDRWRGLYGLHQFDAELVAGDFA
jgi:hypothetical protein